MKRRHLQMNKIKNPFTYSVGHGFIGLSCGHRCKYFIFDKKSNERKCLLYKLLLNHIMLNEHGSIRSEFFCKKYENFKSENSSGAHEIGIIEFETIKNKLEDNILYEACHKEYLCITPFDEIEKLDD